MKISIERPEIPTDVFLYKVVDLYVMIKTQQIRLFKKNNNVLAVHILNFKKKLILNKLTKTNSYLIVFYIPRSADILKCLPGTKCLKDTPMSERCGIGF